MFYGHWRFHENFAYVKVWEPLSLDSVPRRMTRWHKILINVATHRLHWIRLSWLPPPPQNRELPSSDCDSGTVTVEQWRRRSATRSHFSFEVQTLTRLRVCDSRIVSSFVSLSLWNNPPDSPTPRFAIHSIMPRYVLVKITITKWRITHFYLAFTSCLRNLCCALCQFVLN